MRAQYTHTPTHAHRQVHTCTNTNIHTCKHTHIVTHTHLGRYLLRSSSGGPCGHLEPGEENPDANGCHPAQKPIWQGRATVPTVPRQAPHVTRSTPPGPPHSCTLSNKKQHTACAQRAPEPPFLRDQAAGALWRGITTLYAFFSSVVSFLKKCVSLSPLFLLFLIIFWPIVLVR